MSHHVNMTALKKVHCCSQTLMGLKYVIVWMSCVPRAACHNPLLQFQLLTALVSSVKCVFRTPMCTLLFPLTPHLLPHLPLPALPPHPPRGGLAPSLKPSRAGWTEWEKQTKRRRQDKVISVACSLGPDRDWKHAPVACSFRNNHSHLVGLCKDCIASSSSSWANTHKHTQWYSVYNSHE